jgi:hypothetical protein
MVSVLGYASWDNRFVCFFFFCFDCWGDDLIGLAIWTLVSAWGMNLLLPGTGRAVARKEMPVHSVGAPFHAQWRNIVSHVSGKCRCSFQTDFAITISVAYIYIFFLLKET